MELARLITALSDPAAYPGTVEAVEVRQTHISVVFLAGSHAYKVKKSVAFGFLDFSTPEQRRHFCEREVLLNRRLAASVYQRVVPITLEDSGLRVEGRGEAFEWAVKMERLPDSATLGAWVRRGEANVSHVDALARRIATFHERAEAGPGVAACGRFDVVAGNARENLEQSAGHVGATVSRAVYDRLRDLTESALADLRPLIDERAERGVPRDGHGDLRLDHVYLFPDRPQPSDLVIIDCIEFNERYRWADPVADIAFLVMDLAARGRRDLGRAFADSYFRAAGDEEGRALLPFYTAYRAAVRGKVKGIESLEPEVPETERIAARERARGHWLQALSELENPSRRPCMVLVGGLPGTGKSTLARGLAERAAFNVIRSDTVRKELASVESGRPVASTFETGIYTPECTGRTYVECLRQAEARLFEGERVLVDASFRAEANRHLFLEAATRWGVPALLLLCHADPEVVRARLERRRNDASDADWAIYQRAALGWEEPGAESRRAMREIATDEGEPVALVRVLDVLREVGLLREVGRAESPGSGRRAHP